MSDQIISLGKSLVQHGKENDRIYLMKLSRSDMPGILAALDTLAEKYGYSKIFAKIPASARDKFLGAGYVEEAVIPGFFRSAEDGCFVGKFFKADRMREADPETAQKVLSAAKDKTAQAPQVLPGDFAIKRAGPADAADLAAVYRNVFASYPFPIHDPAYIQKSMGENVVYFSARHAGTLAAISSCEISRPQLNAEMTDFAVLSGYRGKNLSLALLYTMERALRVRGIHMAYTIARAYSFSMNITFAKAGYTFAGTLINNTHIAGRIESMNVWYKALT